MQKRVFHVRVPAEAACLRTVRAFVGAALEEALGEEEAASVVLALDEACSNIVKHRARIRGRDEIDVRMEVEPAAVRFRIGCFCAQQDVPRIRPRDLADLRPGGVGTRLIGQIMDRIEYEPDPTTPGLMVLVLEKRLQGPRP
jgi:sigma-B regulation protein RsbU (phosphoserine phosphatase)